MEKNVDLQRSDSGTTEVQIPCPLTVIAANGLRYIIDLAFRSALAVFAVGQVLVFCLVDTTFHLSPLGLRCPESLKCLAI